MATLDELPFSSLNNFELESLRHNDIPSDSISYEGMYFDISSFDCASDDSDILNSYCGAGLTSNYIYFS